MIHKPSFLRPALPILGLGFALMASSGCTGKAFAQPATPVEALVYSTMPTTQAHRMEMAMDGDPSTYFKSYYNMGDGDDFVVLLSRPIPITGITVSTGDENGDDTLTKGYVETTPDATNLFMKAAYTKAATFGTDGVAKGTLPNTLVQAIRIKVNANSSLPSLLIKEIKIDSPVKISHVQMGPGRAFSDVSESPDLLGWATIAERKMADFWPDTQAILASPGFITPNSVNVVYTTGPNVTPVAATGGGVMTVNTAWCHQHPEDTGLTVHEMSHVVQSMSAYNPVWLIESISDYCRWVSYEPQNFKARINLNTAKYNDPYQSGATFLAWCSLHYDNLLVTHLNHEIRFGNYTADDWKKFTGKDVDTLFAEFLAAYKADPKGIITPPTPPAALPRELPVPNQATNVAVDLGTSFNAVGFTKDGATFGTDQGFDSGGASFSTELLSAIKPSGGVSFKVKTGEGSNMISSQGNVIALPKGKFSTLWLLGAAVEGNQMNQELTVTYADGSKQVLTQNFSDWYTPQRFIGESRAARMEYRNMADGTKDPRTFNAYRYGFKLDASKEVASLTLPNNPMVKILAATVSN